MHLPEASMRVGKVRCILYLLVFLQVSCAKEEIAQLADATDSVSFAGAPNAAMQFFLMSEIANRPQLTLAEAKAFAVSWFSASKSSRMRGEVCYEDYFLEPQCYTPRPIHRGAKAQRADIDTLFYVLHLKSGGSLLLAGDRRTFPLLGVLDAGMLDLTAEDGSSPFSVLLSHLGSFMQSERNTFAMRMDSLSAYDEGSRAQPKWMREEVDEDEEEDEEEEGRKRKGERDEQAPPKCGGGSYDPPVYVEYGSWEVVEEVRPLTVNWHQRSPFNDEAPLVKGKRALAGCVAIACAQLLSAHRYPRSSYRRAQFDWEWLLRDPSDWNDDQRHQAALLVRGIGDELWNWWGEDGTSSAFRFVPSVFRSMGYGYEGRVSDYNPNGIAASVRHGRPVPMGGSSAVYDFFLFTVPADGHVWLADGFKCYRRWVSVRSWDTRKESYGYYQTCRLIHYNWGWAGAYNGYFLENVFAAHNARDSVNPMSAGKHNYKHDVENILYIRP